VSETAAGTDASGAAAGGSRTGGCFCGSVRYSFAGEPLWVAHCHCSMCRRAQGAGFVTWVGVDAARFELLAGAGSLNRYRSSPAATRSFCSNCGTPLFFESSRWPGQVHLTLATLDSDEGLEPQAHAYWSSRAHWADWSGRDLPRVDPQDGPDTG
jgi:hypothetical protein